MLIKISLQEAQCIYGTVFTVNFLGPILNLYGTNAVQSTLTLADNFRHPKIVR